MSMPMMILYRSPLMIANWIGISLSAILWFPNIIVVANLAVYHGLPLTPPTLRLEASTFS
jgi:hypothetical protein